ncbi:Cof-type HAD-IIB family hydrolase [Actinoplanes awajinensis]|uniref:Haloacid dehalogenase n=1 Tax=Actinoplanes awajinensis subsp. mycoplanecinus TaxID=135947 RepID=A0A101JJH2_9ACTN|nr:Cof-type HAD-IIB family hydrolase [Actinoplanes awajinensis]KUL28005.1 haloacid dehalogenase [Actinoplanes awajinensis subsp. mycoplanecinus]
MTDATDPGQPIAAVLADVDGTLVTKQKELTPRTIAAVRELRRRGVVFALTSGRPPRGMQMLVEPLGMRLPMAAFNGGVIVLPDMTIADERAIDPEAAAGVIEAGRAHGLDMWVYTATDWYVTDPHAPHVDRESHTCRFPPTVVPGYDGLLEHAIKIVGVSDDHDLVARAEAAAQSRFGARVSAARSQPHYLDVTHPTANKGVVVERLAHYFTIPLTQIATFGDQANDVLMFRRSAMSIAMGNASEQVRRQATYVTGSNEEDGFADAVERHILPRVPVSGGSGAPG